MVLQQAAPLALVGMWAGLSMFVLNREESKFGISFPIVKKDYWYFYYERMAVAHPVVTTFVLFSLRRCCVVTD